MAPASVTRTSSRARLRSGASRRAAQPAGRGPQSRCETNRDRGSGPMLSWLPIVPEAGCRSGAGILVRARSSPTPIRPESRRPNRPSPGCCRTAGTCSGRLRRWWWPASSWPAWSGCAHSAPGGINRGPVPSYDAASALHADAQTLGFPVRLPQLPAGWQANSGGRGGIADGRTDPSTGSGCARSPRPSGTSARRDVCEPDPEQRRRGQAGRLDPSVDVSERNASTWTATAGSSTQGESGADTEPVWTTRLNSPAGPAQIAITGAGKHRRISYSGGGHPVAAAAPAQADRRGHRA